MLTTMAIRLDYISPQRCVTNQKRAVIKNIKHKWSG